MRSLGVQEVEKEVVEDVPGKKSRKRTLREMEYCYEAELEGAHLPPVKRPIMFSIA